MSVVVRVSEELYEAAKRIAAVRGVAPAEVMADAWREYLAAHREEFAADFERAAELIRSGDSERLVELGSRSTRARAERAAQRAQG